ncbi:MAG: ferritin family protein [Elusimicrobiota bacterium]
MDKLEDSRTFENLRKAFAEEAALAFRYLYYAMLAEFEGMENHSAAFKEIAEGGTTSVHGCFDFLRLARDPESGIAVGGTFKNLESLLQTETKQSDETYPGMARTAREEGLTDIASWFETLEKAKRAHARKLKALAHE